MCFFAFLYTEETFKRHWLRNKKRVFLYGLPMLFLTVLLFLSQFTGWIFYLDENNRHCRGPLYPVQLLIAGGYLLYASAKSFFLALRSRDYSARRFFRDRDLFRAAADYHPLSDLFAAGSAHHGGRDPIFSAFVYPHAQMHGVP